MPKPQSKSLLFLGAEGHTRLAETSFNSMAEKMGLSWRAKSRGLSSEEDATSAGESADRIVILGDDRSRLPQDRFAGSAEKVESWQIGSGSDTAALIEREVMNLVARILGGGRPPGEAEKSPAPERNPAPARPGKPVTARVGRETAGRRGKGVTTVFDLQLDDADLRELATRLKQQCGTGGTVKEGRIEIQGDHRDRITAELERLGYKVKRTGG